MDPRKIVAVDLFCGSGGMTCGLMEAGIKVSAGIDREEHCRWAFEHNHPGAKFLTQDIRKVTGSALSALWPEGSVRLLAGCAPCQPFSKYTYRLPRDERWVLLLQFSRLVSETLPELIVMENVPELKARGSDVLDEFVAKLKKLEYQVDHDILDCSRYGVPQRRKRFVLVASRFGEIKLPPPQRGPTPTVASAIGRMPPIAAGESSDRDELHYASRLSKLNLERLSHAKQGGSWRDWPPHLVLECHKRKSGHSYTSVYGRMSWALPAPTMTTLCVGIGNGRFGHPDQDRAISLREAALIQSFPKSYQFCPPGELCVRDAARMIGNAVPPRLAEHIGRHLAAHVLEYGKSQNGRIAIGHSAR